MHLLPRLAIVLLVLTLGACAARDTGTVSIPDPTPPAEAPAATTLNPIVATALAQQGVPYQWGGSDPSGFDCSGLVQYVFAQHGVTLPRETADQYGVGQEASVQELQPGDLVFFQTVSRGPSHVGIALGDNRFVHAPSEGGTVRVEQLSMIYWSRRVIGARRIPTAVMTSAEPATPSLVMAETPATSPAPVPVPVSRPVPRARPFPGALLPTD